MKQRFALLRQFPMNLFLTERPIKLVVFNVPPLLIKKGFDVFVCHLLRQWPIQFFALFKALEELVDRRPLPFARVLGDGSSAVAIFKMKLQHLFVVHMRTPL